MSSTSRQTVSRASRSVPATLLPGLWIRIHFLLIRIQLIFNADPYLSSLLSNFLPFIFLNFLPPGSRSRRENECGSGSTALPSTLANSQFPGWYSLTCSGERGFLSFSIKFCYSFLLSFPLQKRVPVLSYNKLLLVRCLINNIYFLKPPRENKFGLRFSLSKWCSYLLKF